MERATGIPFAGCLTKNPGLASPWAFLGIADDSQSSFQKGPAAAPQAMRRAYDGNCFNATSESGVDLTGAVVDHGDLTPLSSWERSATAYLEKAEDLFRSGKTPFFAGGDHAVTVPIVQALEVLGGGIHVVQIDAHPDLYPDFEGNPNSHACTAARILEMDHVESLTQIGIRTMNALQRDEKERYGDRCRILHARDLPGEIPRLDHLASGAPVYVTIDIDGLDPSCAPGVSHPVPGGLTARQVLSFLQSASWTLVGMDVVEVNPARDLQYQTAILAARLLHEGMGYAAKMDRGRRAQ